MDPRRRRHDRRDRDRHGGISSGTAVLAGSLGRDMLRSTDGGATWRRAGSFPVFAQFQKPSFATEQRVIAIRPEGRIALSDDAGQTWRIAYDRLGQIGLTNTTMASATLGLVVGDDGLILRTTDGGSSWAAVVSGTTLPLKSVGCLTAMVCLAGGFDGALLKRRRRRDVVGDEIAGDGCWQSDTHDRSLQRHHRRPGCRRRTMAQCRCGRHVGACVYPDRRQPARCVLQRRGIGIATGYDGILRSTDQGVTWTQQSVPIPSTWPPPRGHRHHGAGGRRGRGHLENAGGRAARPVATARASTQARLRRSQ